MAAQREEAHNAALAAAINGLGDIIAKAEAIVRSGSIDVVADVRNVRVAVEAKRLTTQSDVEQQATRAAEQAWKRIAQKEAMLGAVLVYPPGLAAEDVASSDDLRWTHVPDRYSRVDANELERGSPAQFATWLHALVSSVDPSAATAMLLDALTAARALLDDGQKKALLAAFNIHPTSLSKPRLTAEQARDNAVIRVLLMVTAATMFHARLHRHLLDLPLAKHPAPDPESTPQVWRPPETPGGCLDAEDPVAALVTAWRLILRVDYRPVFESGIHALRTLAGSPGWPGALQTLVAAALSVAQAVPVLRHDLLGGVFHRVLDTSRYDGSFYTTTAAATMLAHLAIRPGERNWTKIDEVAKARICDPACGSGTLLMAAAERIHALREDAAASGSDDDGRQVGAHLIESVLWGYDINPTAIHLAATTLGLLSPSVAFSGMNLFHTEFGVEDSGAVHLGSLDLLPPGPESGATQQLALSDWRAGQQRQVEEDLQKIARQPEPMSLVIMNPPFTRDSLRHDQLGAEGERRVKEAEKNRLTGHTYRRAARLHSSGGMFALLGEHLLDTSRATLAQVLPAVVASNAGNVEIRQFLANQLQLDTIVFSHDPKRFNMSGNTQIAEMLVVARRGGDDADQPVRIVQLVNNPVDLIEARNVLRWLDDYDPGSREQYPNKASPFVVDTMSQADARVGDWRRLGFLTPHLYDLMKDVEGKCIQLSEIADVGPGGQRIRDTYAPNPVASGRKALWEHKADRVTSMAAQTDVWIMKKSSKRQQRLADKYWDQRSNLLIANRLWWKTMRLSCVRTEVASVGSLFCPVRPKLEGVTRRAAADRERLEKALCVWLNSTLGTLCMYGNRDYQNSYSKFSLENLRVLPVPELTDAQAKTLATCYGRYSRSKLRPYPQMAECRTRAALDEAVVVALGGQLAVDADTMELARQSLAAEPFLTNERVPL